MSIAAVTHTGIHAGFMPNQDRSGSPNSSGELKRTEPVMRALLRCPGRVNDKRGKPEENCQKVESTNCHAATFARTAYGISLSIRHLVRGYFESPSLRFPTILSVRQCFTDDPE